MYAPLSVLLQVVAHIGEHTSLLPTSIVKKLCYIGFVAQNVPLICPSKVLYTHSFTVNGETFAGLNFRSVDSVWIFVAILSWYKARAQYMFILRAKIHISHFSEKPQKPRKFSSVKLSLFMVCTVLLALN